MTKEQLAQRLNGRQYGDEIAKQEEAQAKEGDLVVVFGTSDDLLEFRGAIHDEVGAWEGTEVCLTSDGLLANECHVDCPYFEKLIETTKDKVTAIWSKDGYSWVIESTLPYAPFDILEDGEKYCRGIVLEMAK